MHFVDKPLLQILPKYIHPAEDTNILAASCFARTFQCSMNAFCDKMECRSAFHREGSPGMMCEHKCRSVIRWVVAPPSLPAVIGPRAATQREHISPKDPCADIAHTADRKIVIH